MPDYPATPTLRTDLGAGRELIVQPDDYDPTAIGGWQYVISWVDRYAGRQLGYVRADRTGWESMTTDAFAAKYLYREAGEARWHETLDAAARSLLALADQEDED